MGGTGAYHIWWQIDHISQIAEKALVKIDAALAQTQAWTANAPFPAYPPYCDPVIPAELAQKLPFLMILPSSRSANMGQNR